MEGGSERTGEGEGQRALEDVTRSVCLKVILSRHGMITLLRAAGDVLLLSLGGFLRNQPGPLRHAHRGERQRAG